MHVWSVFLVDCQLSRHQKVSLLYFAITFGMSISFISCERCTRHIFIPNCAAVAVGTKSRKCLLSLLLDTIGTQHIANRSFWSVLTARVCECLHSHFRGSARLYTNIVSSLALASFFFSNWRWMCKQWRNRNPVKSLLHNIFGRNWKSSSNFGFLLLHVLLFFGVYFLWNFIQLDVLASLCYMAINL